MGNSACCQTETYKQYDNNLQQNNDIVLSKNPNQQLDMVNLQENTKELNEALSKLPSNVKQHILKQKPFSAQLKPNAPIKKFKDQIYQGQLNQDGKPHGYGTMYYPTGDVFLGHFQNGFADGDGHYVWANGSYYKGKITKNIANDSSGIYKNKDVTYEGRITDNKIQGFGKHVGQGYTFNGVIENGKMKNGKLEWIQQVKNRLSISQQEVLIENHYTYEGFFDQEQKFTGQGILIGPKGKYAGGFIKGLKNGYGVFEFTNKLRYEGEYRQNEKNGNGTLYSTDNKVAYCGQFAKGLPHGSGWVPQPDGSQNHMQFEQGISISIKGDKK